MLHILFWLDPQISALADNYFQKKNHKRAIQTVLNFTNGLTIKFMIRISIRLQVQHLIDLVFSINVCYI